MVVVVVVEWRLWLEITRERAARLNQDNELKDVKRKKRKERAELQTWVINLCELVTATDTCQISDMKII